MSTISSDYSSVLNLGTAASTAAETASSESLGQADFLLLMTTQLQHQDPLNPMDNAEMVAQLAQMSTVQGLETLNSTVTSLSSSMANDQILRATNLVGHGVLVPSDYFSLEESGGASGVIAASGPGSLTVGVFDASGKQVATLNETASSSGELAFQWDGNDSNGNRLPAGKYSVSAQFIPAGGEAEAVQTYIQAPVESVLIGSDGLYLNLKNLGTTSLDQVLRVS